MIVQRRTAHSDSLIGVTRHDRNTFLTSSQDNTVRLWDIRTLSSIKLFRNPTLLNLTNPASDGQNTIFIGTHSKVMRFDMRVGDIFIQTPTACSQPHLDDINTIRYTTLLSVCDDEGDIRLYDKQLKCLHLLDQGHTNICNAALLLDQNTCVSGGYDNRLKLWDMKKEEQKCIDMRQQYKKWGVQFTYTLPFIHDIREIRNNAQYSHNVLLAMETGHVVGCNVKKINKPKFIIEASLTRVVSAQSCIFDAEAIITLSMDASFSLFTIAGEPTFREKVKTLDQPQSMESMEGGKILVAAHSPQLSIYSLK